MLNLIGCVGEGSVNDVHMDDHTLPGTCHSDSSDFHLCPGIVHARRRRFCARLRAQPIFQIYSVSHNIEQP